MPTIKKLEELKQKFYFKDNKPDIYYYGEYRLGLTSDEIKDYLRVRANNMNVSKISKTFNKIAGCNTGTMTSTGKSLMYRHDVERFADVIFERKLTYFD
jgi:hypothetical protein